MNIEFISYDGEYPSLCLGVLVVKIDGKEYKFGHHSEDYNWKTCLYTDNNFDSFWTSGGHIGGDYGHLYAEQDDWQLSYDKDKYPKWIIELFPQLINLFNKHVTKGCCGGCI